MNSPHLVLLVLCVGWKQLPYTFPFHRYIDWHQCLSDHIVSFAMIMGGFQCHASITSANLLNVIGHKLRSNWQDFKWRSASHDPPAIAELLLYCRQMQLLMKIGCSFVLYTCAAHKQWHMLWLNTKKTNLCDLKATIICNNRKAFTRGRADLF